MGQKANPNAMRFGIIKDYKAQWFVTTENKQDFAKFAIQDKKIRQYLAQFDKKWLTGDIIISRKDNELNIEIWSAKPGQVLGQDGAEIKKHEIEIKRIVKNKNIKVSLEVKEVANPDLNAKILANEIAISLENRGSFRVAQKKIIARALKAGAKGIKTMVSGRLNGVDMARSEGYSEGITPLQTIRNDIDFAIGEAHTTFGVLGIKVWISRGEVLGSKEAAMAKIKDETNKASAVVRERRQFDPNRKPFERKPFDPNRPRRPFDPNRPRPIDPTTGKPFERKPFDPNRPRPIDPTTGKPFERKPFDPNRPRPIDPKTGKPFERKPFDPNRKPFTGIRPRQIDPMTGKPIERKPFDPNRPRAIDPKTGKPFERRPFDPNRKPFDPNRPRFNSENKPAHGHNHDKKEVNK